MCKSRLQVGLSGLPGNPVGYIGSTHTVMKTIRKQSGISLIETVIGVVILGLLMGGVVAGTELIANARVRTLLVEQDAIKVAYFGFRDRFRALPGDYSAASINISCTPACSNGDGNGVITGITDVPPAQINEHLAVWEHLSNSGFLTGNYSYAAVESPRTSPVLVYGQYPLLKFDAVYDGAASARHNLKVGSQVPSNILAEIDRKIDDGYATTGAYRFSSIVPSGNAPSSGNTLGSLGIVVGNNTQNSFVAPVGAGSCYSAIPPNQWALSNPVSNCGAAELL
jgi:hypothetical protein